MGAGPIAMTSVCVFSVYLPHLSPSLHHLLLPRKRCHQKPAHTINFESSLGPCWASARHTITTLNRASFSAQE